MTSQSSHSEHSSHHMQFFSVGFNVPILFKEWNLNTKTGLFLTCVGSILLGVLYQIVKCLRQYAHRRYRVKERCEEMWRSPESRSIFVGLCELFGTSEQVTFRRETNDITDLVITRAQTRDDVTEILSGSFREGFRHVESDMDFMYWLNNHRVIMDMSQFKYYNTANTTLILSYSSESPPGYTLLRLLTPTINESNVHLACVGMNGSLYISSSIYRKITCSVAIPNSSVHGPCGSGYVARKQYDTAWCFVCDFWPLSASSWIERCHSWPESEVVNEIVKSGCHFVAVGHPLGLHAKKEWRISFSCAEYKLVSHMNHCQFLTYGLLKLFLKEVINQQSKKTCKLLCSYHIKTTIFWAIQLNTQLQWCPNNVLNCFWVCFKLLVKWVYEGICPNFFIPQNNMFLKKVFGSAQNRLFLQLHELYEEGLDCLSRSTSFRSKIIDVLFNPRQLFCIGESIIRSEVDHDADLFTEILHNDRTILDEICSCVRFLNVIEQHFLESPLTGFQDVMVQRLTATALQKTAFLLHTNTKSNINKHIYKGDKKIYHMLKLAAKFGFISDMLYISMYYYKTFRYREALSVIKMTKTKLRQPYLMHCGRVDKERYTEAVGGKSRSTKMRQAVVKDITLMNKISYIKELEPEQLTATENGWYTLNIPVHVMLHFLEFLCYRHIDKTLSQAALDKLQVLVHHGQGLHIFDINKDISWEILGICQQMSGNIQAALYAYRQSLSHQTHYIKNATKRRIFDIVHSTAN